MAQRISVLGYGPVGRAATAQLVARGDQVTVCQRTKPKSVPPQVQFKSANLLSARGAKAACANVDAVVCAAGVPYDNRLWVRNWPIIMRNVLTGCEASGARLIFADNLYMYGPQTEPLREDMPLTAFGAKPRVRAEITRLWQDAHRAGKVKAVAVRAADFYGPGIATSVISEFGVARLLKGKSAQSPFPIDVAHTFTYVPDFARALVSLADAPASDYGQAWHAPNAAAMTVRDILARAAEIAQAKLRTSEMPRWLRSLLSNFSAPLHAMAEMDFQWDRPYLVDTSKFAARFWADAMPWDVGLGETIAWYRRVNAV